MKAIITGASRGIGQAVATALAAKGYDLALCARTLAPLEKFAAQLKLAHPTIEVVCVAADLSKPNEARKFAANITTRWTAVDVLVNNVGAYQQGLFSEISETAIEEALAVNVLSANAITRAVVPGMKAKNSGHIFNICSVLSHEIRAEAAPYTISKHALLALSKVLSEEMRDHGVKVTAVLPGSVNTSSWDGIEAPLFDFVQPKDIAELILTVLNLSAGALVEEIIVRPMRKDC